MSVPTRTAAPATAPLPGSRTTARRRAGAEDDPFVPPILHARPGGLAERFSARLDGRHPALVFFAAVLLGFALVAALSIGVGYLVNHVLLPFAGIGAADESVNVWLAGHRTATDTDISAVGSAVGGAPVLPILIGIIALVLLALRRWRLAAFVVFALAVESALYRVTTLAIHRHRPDVARLEQLPVNASYPSGHTAASVAVYSGIALLLTSRFTDGRFRVLAWAAAVAVTLLVASSRMYRGMHHPSDPIAGAILGMAALVILVFACRAAGVAARARVAA